jgi:hypothetical protein
MTITTSSFAKALWPGVNAWYGKAYNEHAVEWDKLFDKFTSKRNYEEDVGVTSFGLAVEKAEGMPISFDSERQGFTTRYRHVTYGLGFVITREIMEDDQYDVVGQRRAQGLAFSMRQTKEIIAANVYNRAFNSSYTFGDGKELLATDHPNVAGGTWSNELATASDLSEAALEQACIDIGLLENDRGLQISLIGDRLVIPVQLEFEAHRILKSQLRVSVANNDANALKDMGKFKGGVVVNHYLTDSDAWFIRTNAPHGMKYFSRREDEFGTDNDFDTENAKFKATARYSFGATDPRGLFGSPGA